MIELAAALALMLTVLAVYATALAMSYAFKGAAWVIVRVSDWADSRDRARAKRGQS